MNVNNLSLRGTKQSVVKSDFEYYSTDCFSRFSFAMTAFSQLLLILLNTEKGN